MIDDSTGWWMMRDGTRIKIKNMKDSHLLNTIKMMEDRVIPGMEDEISAGWQIYGFVQGEMAEMCIEQDLGRAEEDLFEAQGKLSELKAEADKRGLCTKYPAYV